MPTRRAARIREKVLRASGLGLLVALAACTFEIGPPSVPRPDVIYEPDLVGPITEVAHDGITDTYTVTVAGESFDIGPDAVSLDGSPGSSDSFLIYGTDGGTTWYASIGVASTGKRAGCAALSNSDAWDAGDAIVFAFTGDSKSDAVGVRLPKSDEWDEDIDLEPDGRFPAYYNRWCIDLRGRVSAVYPGGA
jgi:hypothetical protein